MNNLNNLFRPEALVLATTPEQLDQVMRVVSPRNWLPLAAAGVLVTAGLTWGIVGRSTRNQSHPGRPRTVNR